MTQRGRGSRQSAAKRRDGGPTCISSFDSASRSAPRPQRPDHHCHQPGDGEDLSDPEEKSPLEKLESLVRHFLTDRGEPGSHVLAEVAQPYGHLLTDLAQSCGELLTDLAQSCGELLTDLAQSCGELLTERGEALYHLDADPGRF